MRHNRLAAALVLAALFGAASNATAKDVKIGDTSIVLTPSPGFCELRSDQHLFDRVLLSLTKRTKRLGYFWKCEHLDAARQGKYVPQHTASFSNKIPRVVKPDFISKVCAMRRQLSKSDLQNLKKEFDKTVPSMVTVDEVRDIGVVAEDDETCYMANTHLTTSLGKKQLRLTLCALTRVRGIALTYCLDRPNTDDALGEMLTQSKKDIAALQKANAG